MIRRSAIIAAIAAIASIILHVLILGFTWTLDRGPQGPSQDGTSTEVSTPGSTFEDLVEAVTEPVTPEPAPEPEPVVEPAPVPEPEDTPTSQALIASETPQQEVTPDTGTAQSTETTGPVTPDDGDAAQPATGEPAGPEVGEAADPELTPPAGTDTVTDIPLGEPNAPAEPTQTPAQTTAIAPSAAVPPTAAPTPPVTVAPVPLSVPVVSIEPVESAPDTPETIVQPVPEPPQDPVENDASDTAVTTSLRPRLPTKRPPPNGLSDGSSQTTTARRAPAPLIESPLTAYKRNGSNIFGQQGSRPQRGGQGFRNSRSAGNSDTTNYVGLVLSQLNRTASVPVSGRGWARVLFRINPDGTLASVVIVDSSGSSSIDRAAQQQVRSAGSFPRPPGGKSRSLNFFYRIQ